ncbi:hypothetical protein [Rhodobacter sp. CZR27]|uniref:hypothetical protein n=1 Tax=Rhodobacter sp. CZR27 TaxID=2033869 RepID=UPI001E402FC4|nr:hypothetical protein [Rhodobacter sp. CZR27]
MPQVQYQTVREVADRLKVAEATVRNCGGTAASGCGLDWIVLTVPRHPTGLSHEDTRTPLIQLTRAAGFGGWLAVASHGVGETEALFGASADTVLEPFRDAADRAVEILGGAAAERTQIPEIATEGHLAP